MRGLFFGVCWEDDDGDEDGGSVRRPTHAGSWYAGDGTALRGQIRKLLGAEYAQGVVPDASLKAVISPHAGLSYSGSVAAAVYARVKPDAVKRVFLLGPSHHARVPGCGLPGQGVTAYGTPCGELPLDLEALEDLRQSGLFSTLTMDVDEAEHSLEMQLPFLAELFLHAPLRGSSPPGLVPILVGRVSAAEEARYGRLLAKYLSEPGSLFVVSSDFCHWGARFNYTTTGSPALAETYRDGPRPENAGIEGLDREGMAHISRQDAPSFRQYLARDGNTICGRHPILVMLEALQASPEKMRCDFVRYLQSSALPGAAPPTSSSVSYACACLRPVFVPGV